MAWSLATVKEYSSVLVIVLLEVIWALLDLEPVPERSGLEGMEALLLKKKRVSVPIWERNLRFLTGSISTYAEPFRP